MKRWTPQVSSPAPQRWQSRREILNEYLDSLSPDEMLRSHPYHWALRHGPGSSRYAALEERAFNPNQPRVPAGNPDGGQWTSDGRWIGTRFAAAEGPRIGPLERIRLALETARKLIDAFRSENGLWDLFGRRDGAVTVTTIDGKDIYGSNSGLPMYRAIDRAEADNLRSTLFEKYPQLREKYPHLADSDSGMPLNALYHAETNVLVRAAREHGGSLAGRTLEIFGDRRLCNNCDVVLPYVGLEIGNPTVTFVGPNGARRTMRDGRWID